MSPAHRGRVRVDVPATSANLGPGFDALGLALELRDEVDVAWLPADDAAPDDAAPDDAAPDDGEPDVVVRTEDADGAPCADVPTGPDNLIAATVRGELQRLGHPPGRLRIRCRSRIPHGRGLGSSAAAIVAGVLAARALAGLPRDGEAELARAAELEGHPDNVAPCLTGGATVAWTDDDGTHAVPLPTDPRIRACLAVATEPVPTERARGLLPATVPHADAAFTAGRAALLVHALAGAVDLLLAGTADRLHQDQRASAMPETAALMRALRARGLAAVVSGAGPTVLVLSGVDAVATVRSEAPEGWLVVPLALAVGGATVSPVQDQ